jgi:hypothetical protein
VTGTAYNVGPVAEQLSASLRSALVASGGSLPSRVEVGVQAAPEGDSSTTWADVPAASSPRRLVLLAGCSQDAVASVSVNHESPRDAPVEEDAVSVAASDRSLGGSVPACGPSPSVDVVTESVRGAGRNSGAVVPNMDTPNRSDGPLDFSRGTRSQAVPESPAEGVTGVTRSVTSVVTAGPSGAGHGAVRRSVDEEERARPSGVGHGRAPRSHSPPPVGFGGRGLRNIGRGASRSPVRHSWRWRRSPPYRPEYEPASPFPGVRREERRRRSRDSDPPRRRCH